MGLMGKPFSARPIYHPYHRCSVTTFGVEKDERNAKCKMQKLTTKITPTSESNGGRSQSNGKLKAEN